MKAGGATDPAGAARLRSEARPDARAGARSGAWWFALATVGVIALAAALRFYRLGEWSYWSDEAFTISDANATLLPDRPGRLPEHRLSFAIYGAFFALVRGLGIAFDETVARFLPALFGVAGVALTALLGARSAGRGGAVLGALLVAIAPFHLYWSQNARSYALEMALALPAGLLLGRALRSGGTGALGIGALLLGAAAFAHPTALALAPPLAVFALLGRRWEGQALPRRTIVFLALVAIGLAAVVAATPLGRAIWVHFRVKPDASPVLFVSTTAFYFRPTLLAAGACAALIGWRRRDVSTLLLALLSFGTLGVAFAASFVARANAQYAAAAFPFLGLLVGREVARWIGAGGPSRAAALVLAATLVADLSGGAFLYFGPEHGHRAHWREGAQRLWELSHPADLVVSTQAPIVECYLRPENLVPRDATRALYVGRFEPEKFETVTVLGRRTWFLLLEADLEEWPREARARLRRYLRESCVPVAEWPVQFAGKDQTLRLWRWDPP